jgi:hypothetical protein
MLSNRSYVYSKICFLTLKKATALLAKAMEKLLTIYTTAA